MKSATKKATTTKRAAVRAPQASSRMTSPAKKSAPPAAIAVNLEGAHAEIHGDILTIRVDLSRELRPSDSGKTMIIAQSERFQTLRGPGEWINLMICRKPQAEAAPGPVVVPPAAPRKRK